MSTASIDLVGTRGYLVADRSGHLVGRVECPMYGTSPDVPDALSVKTRQFMPSRFLVPVEIIGEIDAGSRVVALRVNRRALQPFL